MFLYTYTAQGPHTYSKTLAKGPAPLVPWTPSGQGAERPEPPLLEEAFVAKRADRSDEARTEVLTVRLTRSARTKIAHNAAAAGVTVSAWCADVLADGRNVVEVAPTRALNPALVAELKRIGNNINQIAARLNLGKQSLERSVANAMSALMEALLRDEVLASRVGEFERSHPDGATHSPPGNELQGGVRLHPPRPR